MQTTGLQSPRGRGRGQVPEAGAAADLRAERAGAGPEAAEAGRDGHVRRGVRGGRAVVVQAAAAAEPEGAARLGHERGARGAQQHGAHQRRRHAGDGRVREGGGGIRPGQKMKASG